MYCILDQNQAYCLPACVLSLRSRPSSQWMTTVTTCSLPVSSPSGCSACCAMTSPQVTSHSPCFLKGWIMYNYWDRVRKRWRLSWSNLRYVMVCSILPWKSDFLCLQPTASWETTSEVGISGRISVHFKCHQKVVPKVLCSVYLYTVLLCAVMVQQCSSKQPTCPSCFSDLEKTFLTLIFEWNAL